MRQDPSTLHVRFASGLGYPIHFKPLPELPLAMRDVGLRAGRCIVVTDRTVAESYGSVVDSALRADGWEPRLLAFPAGELTKSARLLQAIYDAALAWGIDRQTPIIALGGGVIGDLAGFAAATLLRGLPLVHVPTTLLAQVDSSIGGKTGINHDAGKNLIGAFHQPALVHSDVATLSTLPEREWLSGAAEVVKHALIADSRLFDHLDADWNRFAAREVGIVRDIIIRAARVKVDVVSRDEREHNIRAILNFGHTFGHALEKATGYGVLTHGEAVTIGMRAALYLSRRYHPKLDFQRAERLVRRIPVPPIPADIAIDVLMTAMRSDKKIDAGRLRVILLKRIGDAHMTDSVSASDLQAAWTYALS